jgi:serine protease Do
MNRYSKGELPKSEMSITGKLAGEIAEKITMIRNRRYLGIVLPAAVAAVALIGSAVSQQRTTETVTDPSAVGHAEALSSAFRSAAHAVLPTVVKIKARINERRVLRGNGPNENPFRGTPFEDFFNDQQLFGPFEQRIPRREGMGSGVIINSDGMILTNNHVVGEADVVIVELADGREFKGEDIRTDPQTDLAIVRIKGAGSLPAARLGDSDAMDIGDWVLAIGNPFELEASVSAGIISAKGRSLGAAERASFLQTDAAINPGNSGGPLVNLRGEVVGINTAIASSSGAYQGIGFAIPIDLAKWIIDELVSKGSVSRAWLGVGISELDQEAAESLGIDLRTKGVLVKQVNDGSPAAQAGVRAGDVITHFADQAVTEPSQLQRAVERAPLGSRQKLRVLRRGRELELTVVTEQLPADVARQSRLGQQRDDGEGVTDDQIGLQVAELTPNLIERLELPADAQGVVVVDIDANGIAAESGLRRGMLIVEIDSVTIKTVKDFEQAMSEVDVEKGANLTVKIPGEGTRFLILKQR